MGVEGSEVKEDCWLACGGPTLTQPPPSWACAYDPYRGSRALHDLRLRNPSRPVSSPADLHLAEVAPASSCSRRIRSPVSILIHPIRPRPRPRISSPRPPLAPIPILRAEVAPGVLLQFFHRIVARRGAEPKQLAFSAALGVTLGIFPICGTTVILCGVAIAMLGSSCNAVTVMVLNFVVTPLELSLIVPFLRFGEVITGSGHFPLTSDAFKKVITGQASKDVMLSIVHAMLGWLIAAPFALAALYMVFIPCFKLMVDRFGGVPSSPRTPIKLV
uniref:DUF2062 domain-containing protein n=1 Tax=Oryza rufipogon TaxID=4529 RepID=A0A0E0PGE7_ORYRU